MISSTNSAFANSQINVQLNLVATELVNYRDELFGVVDLERLRLKGEGFLSNLHNLRNEYGADMVTLLVNNAFDVGGISIFPDRESGDPSTKGFNVVTRASQPTSLM